MLSVSMPHYMRQEALSRSLEAYRRIYTDLEISICDDGSIPQVEAPGCIVTRLPAKKFPLNPCVPANAAVRAATRDVIVLTNPEIEHREDVLTPMLAMMDSDMDYIACQCWDTTRKKLLTGPGVLRPQDQKLVPKGAYFHMCALMHRSLFERVGGFDESYRFAWGYEDTDFLWKLSQVGAKFKLYDGMVYHTYVTPSEFRPRPTNEKRFKAKWRHKWD